MVLVANEGGIRYALLHQHEKTPHVRPSVQYDQYALSLVSVAPGLNGSQMESCITRIAGLR